MTEQDKRDEIKSIISKHVDDFLAINQATQFNLTMLVEDDTNLLWLYITTNASKAYSNAFKLSSSEPM